MKTTIIHFLPTFLISFFPTALVAQSNPVDINGRIQVGVISNDNHSKNVFPSGFLSFDEGVNLNRIDVIFEHKIKSNIKPRIGPFPGPKPDKPDWGFQIDTRYGKDAAITFGLDDDLPINEGHENLWLMQQWFVRGYQPWGDGLSFVAGSWFTPVGYEIGCAW